MAQKGLPPVFLNINYIKQIRIYMHYSKFDPLKLHHIENNKFYKKNVRHKWVLCFSFQV
jgi:hypothetical protein